MKSRTHFWMAVTAALLTIALGLFVVIKPAAAQRTVTVATCGTFPGAAPALGSAGIIALDQNGNVCAGATVSASISGFAPGGAFATLTATGSSASVALPAGAVVVFQNTGTTAVSCTLGVGSATAVASNNVISPGGWTALTVGSNTFGACIDQTGSASNVVVLSGGTGLPAGVAGSTGGGPATIADGADVAEGTTTDAACASDNGTCTALALLKRNNQRLTTINTTLGTPMQATGGTVSGTGTAGTAATGVLTVQGIASMTKLLVTPDVNSAVNVAQVNGTTVLVNTGATGTGSPRVTVATDQATNAGAALAKGGVGTVSGGSFYQAVAASQTATTLQSSTGATGDYLSHCVLFPTSTSPGVVTVFDSTNTAANSAILFAGGASSTSNLTPIAVPVGAVSVNGAWKVTTGASISVTCYGKFS